MIGGWEILILAVTLALVVGIVTLAGIVELIIWMTGKKSKPMPQEPPPNSTCRQAKG